MHAVCGTNNFINPPCPPSTHYILHHSCLAGKAALLANSNVEVVTLTGNGSCEMLAVSAPQLHPLPHPAFVCSTPCTSSACWA